MFLLTKEIQEFIHKKVRATHSGSSEQTEPQGSTTELLLLEWSHSEENK